MLNYKDMDVEAIVKKLRSWDLRYFETGTSPVSDATYDKVKSYAKKKFGKHVYFKQIGFQPVSDKVRLPIPMQSLDKKRPTEAEEWARAQGKPNWVLLPKFDGTAGLLHYRKGKLVAAYTRGDGTIGRNITEKAKYIQGVWKNLNIPEVYKDQVKKDFYVRGEFVIHKYIFDKISETTEYKNSRNLCTGMLNKKELTPDDISILKKITFVTFNCEPKKAIEPSQQLIMLGALQFITATWPARLSNHAIKTKDSMYRVPRAVNQHIPDCFHFHAHPTAMFMSNAIGEWERKSQINLDGVVITYNVIKGESYAVKLEPENQATQIGVVKTVEWNKSSRGILKPVVVLKEALLFDGVAVTRATGNNAAFIINNGIYPGVKVKMIRSGDVVPRIISIEQNKKWVKAKLNME